MGAALLSWLYRVTFIEDVPILTFQHTHNLFMMLTLKSQFQFWFQLKDLMQGTWHIVKWFEDVHLTGEVTWLIFKINISLSCVHILPYKWLYLWLAVVGRLYVWLGCDRHMGILFSSLLPVFLVDFVLLTGLWYIYDPVCMLQLLYFAS